MNVDHEISIESKVPAHHGRRLSLPNAIIRVTCVHVAVGLATLLAYLLSKNETWIRVYFDYAGALFFLVFGGLEFFLAILARRQFYADEPLRKAWSFIMLASAVRWVGLALGQLVQRAVRISILSSISFSLGTLKLRPHSRSLVCS